MPGVARTDRDEPPLLEVALRVQGNFRSQLAPLRVTPLQAGVILYLLRHPDAKVTGAAVALCVRQPTMAVLIQDLVRKRWVTKRYSIEDRRAVCLQLSWQGEMLAGRIKDKIRHVRSDFTPLKEA